jgi:hypothetical protein
MDDDERIIIVFYYNEDDREWRVSHGVGEKTLRGYPLPDNVPFEFDYTINEYILSE